MFNPNAPIGIIDSGIGGLCFLRLLRSRMPNEAILYSADEAYFPYGELSPAEIEDRVSVLAEALLSKGAKAIVIACNTATANGIEALRGSMSIPIIGFEPPIKPAVVFSTKKIVGIWATPATTASERFARLVESQRESAHIVVQPCAGLAEAIENEASDLEEIIEHYLQPILAEGADSLVLGCTHYELIAERIAERASPALRIFEPSTGALRQLMRVLEERKLLAAPPERSSRAAPFEIFSTAGDSAFSQRAARWLPAEQLISGSNP